MDPVQFAWVVGLYEGEGTCFLVTHKPGKKNAGQKVPMIALEMVDPEPLERAMKITGLGRFNGPYNRVNHLSTLPHYRWVICAQSQVVQFLDLAWPLLSERRRAQALPVLEWTRQRLLDRANGQFTYAKS